MSQLLEEQQDKVQKLKTHKASDVFLNATEKQCSYFLAIEGKECKEYCAIGLLGLYSGNEPNQAITNIDGGKSYGFSIFGNNFNNLFSFFEMNTSDKHNCPECGKEKTLQRMLPHLNNKARSDIREMNINEDAHGWTFKQIGEWLQKIGH